MGVEDHTVKVWKASAYSGNEQEDNWRVVLTALDKASREALRLRDAKTEWCSVEIILKSAGCS